MGSWITATAYEVDDTVENDGSGYLCTVAHTSGASTEPGVGADWATKWDIFVEGIGGNSFQVDCSGGTSDTYGALSGLVNSSNTTYTVSLGSYVSGSLRVYLNGQLQTQGTSEDWDETTPASGTFDFNTAPTTGDIIIAVYQFTAGSTGNADTLDGLHGASYATIAGTETLTNKTLTSPKLNEDVALTSTSTELNALDGQVGAWTAFTPSWTNLTVGSGTNVGAYCQIGKIVHFRVKFTYGAGSAVGSSPYFALPVTAKVANGVNFTTWYLDANVGYYQGFADISAANMVLHALVASGTYLGSTACTATVPFTWTSTDFIQISGTYEAA